MGKRYTKERIKLQLEYKFKNVKASKRTIKGFSIILVAVCALSITVVSTNRIILASNDMKVEQPEQMQEIKSFESNNSAIDLQKVLNNNLSTIKTIITSEEEQEVEYPVTKVDNPLLPKGEEKVKRAGIKGKDKVTVVRTYENNQVVEEVVTQRTTIEPTTEEIVEVGTSEFLANNKVHIGDTMYLIEDVTLKQMNNEASLDVVSIKKYLDVKLLDLSDDWAKISYEDKDGTKEGYVKNIKLTSSSVNHDVLEKNRLQKIITELDFNMELNKPSGFTEEDFKKMLTGNPQDKNSVFTNNATFFYQMEQKYNLNGVFLAAMGIHESQWGTSRIAMDKKNLFGYGAYDSDAYTYSFEFEDYTEGIELVAKVLVKHYLNTTGTPVYDGELATGKYYNGSNVSGVNVRYATDTNWANAVYTIMENLYKKLEP